VLVLTGSKAVKLQWPEFVDSVGPIYPAELHWNEDPHSVPDPLRRGDEMTSTQVKYMRLKQSDLIT
jgi:hypothetical protein